jgi:hypothetical protein
MLNAAPQSKRIAKLVSGLTMIFLSACERQPPEGSKPALAKVLVATEGSCLVGYEGSICLKLALEVHPPQSPAFQTELTDNVKILWTSRLQPGSWVNVLLDPKNSNKVYLDNGSFSRPAPAPPASTN